MLPFRQPARTYREEGFGGAAEANILLFIMGANVKKKEYDLPLLRSFVAMNKNISFLLLMSFLLASCQQEISFPVDPLANPVVEKLVAAIVITNSPQNEYDSIVFRYLADKTREVHYRLAGDSITRAYYYDNAGRLVKLEDEKAIYYTNNNSATTISFQYNSSGQLIKTFTDFKTVSGVPAYYNNTISGNSKQIIVHDTLYISASYNLDWANRTIFNTLTADNYLMYDSCIWLNSSRGGTTTYVAEYSYDTDKNAKEIRQYTYQDGQLSEWGTVTITRDKPAPVYEALRKKLFRNLANWYETGFVSQDDNYRLFTFPGNMYKKMSYTGYSSDGGVVPLKVIKSIEYENQYDNDLLLKSKVTFSLTGQGTIHYVNQIRYYYK
jgi:hypothetical protein